MKIGILGGSFNPPHVGHLEIGRSALKHLELDEILVIPAGRNPLKRRTGQVSAKQRLKLAELAFGSEPGFAVSDIEVSRPGPSYAIDTLMELHMAMPAEYWFIIGSDLIGEVPRWHHPEDLMKLCRLAVALRPPEKELPTSQSMPEWLSKSIDSFPIDHPRNISATTIRDMIARNVDPSRYLNPAVLDTIKREGLYKD